MRLRYEEALGRYYWYLLLHYIRGYMTCYDIGTAEDGYITPLIAFLAQLQQ